MFTGEDFMMRNRNSKQHPQTNRNNQPADNQPAGSRLTELVFILDRSGSMQGLEADTIGGFNSMIRRQQQLPGRALVSTLLFDDECQVVHDRVDIRRVRPMTGRDYIPGGCTALLDAMGGAIRHIGNLHRYARPADVPRRTLFVITTDGAENASRFYDMETVCRLVRRQQQRYDWEFLFLGANMDAIAAAGRFGIRQDRAVRYQADSRGTRLNFQSVGQAIEAVRCGAPLTAGWKAEIERRG